MSASSGTNHVTQRHVKQKLSAGNKVPGMDLLKMLKTFDVSEQVNIRRHYELLPKVVMSVWQEQYTHLDLHEFQQHLLGESLHMFLYKMRRHFCSVRFKGEKLQEELNILESSNITELIGVRECEISWDSKDSSSTVTSQWPLHAIPKMLCSLSHLKIHMPVQVGFIEQFTQLKTLTLHENVSREVFAAIWKNCKELERIELLGRGTPNTIGIGQCEQLSELTLPVGSFNDSSAYEILQLSKLRFLELQKQDESATSIIDAVWLVLRQRTLDINKFRINGNRLDSTFLYMLNLRNCLHLTSLSLINCLFCELNVDKLGKMPELNNLTFSQCSDLTNAQLLDFVKACPQLAELHLLNCEMLTETFLYKLCEWRCQVKLIVPVLGLYLEDCANLREEFNNHVSNRSYRVGYYVILRLRLIALPTVCSAAHTEFAADAPRRSSDAAHTVLLLNNRS